MLLHGPNLIRENCIIIIIIIIIITIIISYQDGEFFEIFRDSFWWGYILVKAFLPSSTPRNVGTATDLPIYVQSHASRGFI